MDRHQRNHPLPPLSRPWLCAITAGDGPAGLPALQAAARAGVDFIQIREKHLSARDLLSFCAEARAAVHGTAARLLLNDRLDISLAAGLDGVHLPAAGLPPARVRAAVPPGFLLGLSCHSPAEVHAAAAADFCLLGPIFATPSKAAYGPPLGLEALSAAAAHAPCPVLALGGITLENAPACLRHGAAGLAAIRLFQHQPAAMARLRGTTLPCSA